MMPRYFFDLRDGDEFSPDDEGTELDGMEAARSELMQTLPAIAAQQIPHDGNRADFEMIVRDDADRPVMRATLSFTLSQA